MEINNNTVLPHVAFAWAGIVALIERLSPASNIDTLPSSITHTIIVGFSGFHAKSDRPQFNLILKNG